MAMSQWTKQRNEERKANSPFREGMSVAVVNHSFDGRRISRQTKVAKVHKNGNVVLEDSDRQWKPNQTGSHADPVGEKWAREHIEPWTLELENEKREANLKRSLRDRTGSALETIRGMKLTAKQVAALEAIITMGE